MAAGQLFDNSTAVQFGTQMVLRANRRSLLDEFEPLSLLPRPGRQWAAVSGRHKCRVKTRLPVALEAPQCGLQEFFDASGHPDRIDPCTPVHLDWDELLP